MSEEKTSKNSEMEKCEQEREEYLNGWKRAKADLINYQKDEAKRLEEVIRFSNAVMIKELILVLDSFALAEKHDGKDFKMIKNQLEDIMKKSGLERMPVSVDSVFDPNLHEAVGEIESDKTVGIVLEEVESGYLLNGRVIRPAKVKLSRNKQQ